MKFDYKKHLCYIHLAGSRSYGTNIPSSDYDYRGFLIPPPICYKGCLSSFEQKEGLEGYGKDSVAYSINKYIKLCTSANPNIIEGLFVREQDRVLTTKYSNILIDHRDLFLTKLAKKSFCGYAFGQLQRMKNHKAYWDKEKKGLKPSKPNREEYGLPKQPIFKGNSYHQVLSFPKSVFKDDIADMLDRERQFAKAQKEFKDWKEWAENRNRERYEMEMESGYDRKFALHLIRLLRMAKEIFTEGTITVYRPDRDVLLSIRHGEWEYERVIAESTNLNDEIKELAGKSSLPDEPDYEKIDNLCLEIIEEYEKDHKVV